MTNRYNIYNMMLRAAAGEGDGGAGDDDATANAKTINAGDPEDGEGDDTVDGGAGDDTVAGGAGDDTVAAAAAAKPGEKKPVVVPRDVMLRRVGELTRDKRTSQDRIKALEEENARLAAARAGDTVEGGGAPARAEFKTEAEFQQAVKQEAARQRQVDEFNRRCDTVADAGEKDYKETWPDAVANLKMLSDDGNIPWTLLNAALEADDPAKALHELGKNPEEAQRILQLSPIQQVAQVVKHGMKTAPVQRQQKPRSNAADPIDPISGSGGSADGAGLGDDVDDETWMRNRQAQLAAQRRA